MAWVLTGLGTIILVFFVAAGITSILEREKRAAWIILITGIIISLPYLLPLFLDLDFPGWLSLLMESLAGCCIMLLLIPVKGRIDYQYQRPLKRFDERDTMFSRQTLVPGTERFDEYYKRRPENKAADNKFRRRPGLMNPGSKFYDPILFARAQSIFDEVGTLQPRVESEPARDPVQTDPVQTDPEILTDTILQMARQLGAHSSGVTELSEFHVYSVGGRGDRYGKEFAVSNKFAIALTVEMDYHRMRTAPAAQTFVESATQYLRSGKIAVELAEFIRSNGYRARAHIDTNYHVICPLVARDAGLGEIGRMGLLMTPDLGPRVRIAVVTTDLPLIPSAGRPDLTVIDFCRKCEKCALVCPGQSVPFGDEQEIEGVRRWKINSESCYTYWCHAGTDCGRCVIVCPFAHPDNWFHRLVRFGIRRSGIFRSLAITLDDLFYGKKPKPRPSD